MEDTIKLRGSLRLAIQRSNGIAELREVENLIVLQGRSWLLAQLIQPTQQFPSGLITPIYFGSSPIPPQSIDTNLNQSIYPPFGNSLSLAITSTATVAVTSNPPNISFIGNKIISNFSANWNFPLTISEAGMSYNDSSGGLHMFSHVTFTGTTVNTNDTLSVTWTISG